MTDKVSRAEIIGLTEQPWATNDDGYWCLSCGNLIARPETAEAGFLPDSCDQCGFPDPAEVADYHLGGFDDDDCWNCGGEGYVFDCFDGLCVNAEDGCPDCMRRCDVCRGAKP